MLAQDHTSIYIREITKEDIDKYRSDKHFDYREAPPVKNTLWQRFLAWVSNLLSKPAVNTGWQYGKWVLGAIIIYIFLHLILRMQFVGLFRRKDRLESNMLPYELTEESLNQDLQVLLKDALGNKQYRLAVRIRYLIFLKSLVRKDIIAWSPSKTSDEYLDEIKSFETKHIFSQLTNVFNYVWYGERNISIDQYNRVEEVFLDYHKNMSQYEN